MPLWRADAPVEVSGAVKTSACEAPLPVACPPPPDSSLRPVLVDRATGARWYVMDLSGGPKPKPAVHKSKQEVAQVGWPRAGGPPSTWHVTLPPFQDAHSYDLLLYGPVTDEGRAGFRVGVLPALVTFAQALDAMADPPDLPYLHKAMLRVVQVWERGTGRRPPPSAPLPGPGLAAAWKTWYGESSPAPPAVARLLAVLSPAEAGWMEAALLGPLHTELMRVSGPGGVANVVCAERELGLHDAWFGRLTTLAKEGAARLACVLEDLIPRVEFPFVWGGERD